MKKELKIAALFIAALATYNASAAVTESDHYRVTHPDGSIIFDHSILEPANDSIPEPVISFTTSLDVTYLGTAPHTGWAYLTEGGIGTASILSDRVSLTVQQDPHNQFLTEFTFTFESDPGLPIVPLNAPPGSIFDENILRPYSHDPLDHDPAHHTPYLDVTSALFAGTQFEGNEPFRGQIWSDPVPEAGTMAAASVFATSLAASAFRRFRRK